MSSRGGGGGGGSAVVKEQEKKSEGLEAYPCQACLTDDFGKHEGTINGNLTHGMQGFAELEEAVPDKCKGGLPPRAQKSSPRGQSSELSNRSLSKQLTATFLSDFKRRYQRNYKGTVATGRKNLRCFPVCSASDTGKISDGLMHRTSGFCGAPLFFRIAPLTLEDLPEITVVAEFTIRDDDPTLRSRGRQDLPLPMFEEGRRISSNEVADLQRSRRARLNPLMKAEPLKGCKMREDANLGIFVLNQDCSHGWHYGWKSSKANSRVKHCVRVYVFTVVCPRMVGQINPLLECVAVFQSPGFEVVGRETASKRRKRFHDGLGDDELQPRQAAHLEDDSGKADAIRAEKVTIMYKQIKAINKLIQSVVENSQFVDAMRETVKLNPLPLPQLTPSDFDASADRSNASVLTADALERYNTGIFMDTIVDILAEEGDDPKLGMGGLTVRNEAGTLNATAACQPVAAWPPTKNQQCLNALSYAIMEEEHITREIERTLDEASRMCLRSAEFHLSHAIDTFYSFLEQFAAKYGICKADFIELCTTSRSSGYDADSDRKWLHQCIGETLDVHRNIFKNTLHNDPKVDDKQIEMMNHQWRYNGPYADYFEEKVLKHAQLPSIVRKMFCIFHEVFSIAVNASKFEITYKGLKFMAFVEASSMRF